MDNHINYENDTYQTTHEFKPEIYLFDINKCQLQLITKGGKKINKKSNNKKKERYE